MVTEVLSRAEHQRARSTRAAHAAAGLVPGWLIAALLLAAIAPFFFVSTPPLTDLPGHMGRYHIAAALDNSADLRRYYEFTWILAGNLGVDLLVHALRAVVDVERATWAVALLIVVLLFAGIMATSLALHGAVQPHALLALPFIYSYMFLYGFLNYFLAVALALLVFAAWISLAGRPWFRASLLLLAGPLVWLCHLVGWGILATLVGVKVLCDAWSQRDRHWWPLGCEIVLHAAPLAPPLLMTLLWRAQSGGMGDTDYSLLPLLYKLGVLTSILRDQSFLFDMASLAAIWIAARNPFGRQQAAPLIAPILAGGGLFLIALLMPARLFGSFFADARLLPVALITVLLALRWNGSRRAGLLLVAAACGLFVLRMGVTTLGWVNADRVYASRLAALDHVPAGMRIMVLVQKSCSPSLWHGEPSVDHLGSMAIVRRDAFVNTQWQTVGAHSVRAIYNRDTPFFEDPSQFIRIGDCPGLAFPTIGETLPWARKDHFDFLWIFNTSLREPSLPSGLRIVYQDDDSLLAAVER